MHLKPFAQLRCRGTHYEMGVAQGKWLRPRFEKIFASLLENPILSPWIRALGPQVFKVLLTIKGVSVVQNHLRNMERFAPSQVQRIKGMAVGAGWQIELLMGLGSIETRSAHYQYILGCSSLGIGPARSKSGAPLLAYNHDFSAQLRDHLFMRFSRPQDGYDSVQLTYPTLPGCIAGVNAKGVAISLNHAFSTEPFNHGVPPTFLVQEALDHCQNADEVLALFEQTVFSCGSMATVIDAQGGLYAMEIARGYFGVRLPENDLNLTLNDYQIDYMKDIEVPEDAYFDPRKYPEYFHDLLIHHTNRSRRKRFAEIIATYKKFGPNDLKKVLADHEGAKQGRHETICRHHLTSDTIAKAILYPEQKMMEVGRGHACISNYQCFKIN